jgi:predicted dehydrogenase
MKTLLLSGILTLGCMSAFAADSNEVKLITLEPGHFHAGLVQKSMLPRVSPVVRVYSSGGADLQEHLQRIDSYNTRTQSPTTWDEKVYTGPDYFERMLRERAGNVVVLAGNNARKVEFIRKSVDAGFNVLADKPMAINPAGFEELRKAFDSAAAQKVLLYDIMTERHEITTILQRELSRVPALFGTLVKGDPGNPAVIEQSVHHFYKEVSGKPLIRPAWFFDVAQQGEGIVDVTTHLVDLVQWTCFPEVSIDWHKDIQVQSGRRWPTSLTPAQFKKVTGLTAPPAFLKGAADSQGNLNVFANGQIDYTIREIQARVSVIWNFEAPAGAKDTHYSLLRGTHANLVVRQGAEDGWKATLYVENTSDSSDVAFESELAEAIQGLQTRYPGIGMERAGKPWRITVPDKYNVGHEAHFAQVTEDYLRFLAEGKLPVWEVPNMLAKYYTTTKAFELSRPK